MRIAISTAYEAERRAMHFWVAEKHQDAARAILRRLIGHFTHYNLGDRVTITLNDVVVGDAWPNKAGIASFREEGEKMLIRDLHEGARKRRGA